MAVWSKAIYCSCYELGHTWTPSCRQATLDVTASCIYNSIFKIYGPVYLIAALLRRKKKEYFLKKLIPEILQSSIFLSLNGIIFISAFCVWRRINGRFTQWRTAYLPAFTASFLAILFERKLRRGLLAIYMSTIAIESVYQMAVSRGMVIPMHNGEVLLFSIAAAGYMYLFRKVNGLTPSISSGIRFVVGSSEQPQVTGTGDPTSHSSEISAAVPKNKKQLLAYCPRTLQELVKRWRGGASHTLCRHTNSCLTSAIEQSLKMFGIGYSVQATIKVLGALPKAMKGQFRALLQAIQHRDNTGLGAFLASFAFIFKAVSCLLRWTRNSDPELHGLLAGFLAGWSMIFYKSSTVALYLTSKLAEILYFKGIAMGCLPYIKWADIILYAVSTAMVFHVCAFELHNLRPAYWSFMQKLVDDRFGMMNRNLLDVFGTNASKAWTFKPKYDPRFSRLGQ